MEWKKVVVRKNCVVYVRLCSNFMQFVYYCVINLYINVILEVCVYEVFIVLGICRMYFEVYKS